ncbi:hypothetical protein GMLC_02440 [Geomonas limicola]|uniref:Tetrahaem cytochrome domain-containing protein n=1 Tax=Geomonas limicola TaxID=2740186 RepID=A0A6V8N2A0_9BACT|nr:cytochrome c3 family protein [Geomonas limicola]GFO66665.1 hypothetical protein GMLC_02440 [Geomonas limicola]
MKNTTEQRRGFRYGPALIALVIGICAGGVVAAHAAEAKGEELGKVHAGAGIACAMCHVDAQHPQPVPMEKCLSCHGETRKLAEKTANVKPRNPHENRHYGTEADCNICHHQHKKSQNFCLPCHERFDFVVP